MPPMQAITIGFSRDSYTIEEGTQYPIPVVSLLNEFLEPGKEVVIILATIDDSAVGEI